jgi:predicted nucleotidyltransferase
MRLSNSEISTIKQTILQQDNNVDLYLFGSRTNDNLKGGDIDILIIGETKPPLSVIRKIKIALKEKLGDQKIDVVYQQNGKLSAFGELALIDAVKL